MKHIECQNGLFDQLMKFYELLVEIFFCYYIFKKLMVTMRFSFQKKKFTEKFRMAKTFLWLSKRTRLDLT